MMVTDDSEDTKAPSPNYKRLWYALYMLQVDIIVTNVPQLQ